MGKYIGILFLVLLVHPAKAQQADVLLKERGEVCFWFLKPEGVSMELLSRTISIDRVSGDTITAYANANEFQALLKSGIQPVFLPVPSLQYKIKMQGPSKGSLAWDSYPTYEAYLSMMAGFAAGHPEICRIDTIGKSINGRLLLAAKISDFAGLEEAEPQVFYSSSMHGDETAGYGLMLHLIDSLLTGYGSSPQITRLVDSLEIWINPLANPDGTYFSGNATVMGATRENANSVDLNRNFPDLQDGPHPDGKAWQPEAISMMDFMKSKRFCLSANFHGGSAVMNYPWDTWSIRHPDNEWFQFISHLYADSAQHYGPPGYFQDVTASGITNGYDWYTISGGRQDYVTFFLHGREITIELTGYFVLPSEYLPAYWNYNKRSLLHYLEQAFYGLQGFVTDSVTCFPMHAKIEVLNHDQPSAASEVFSDSVNGRYTRLLAAGTYTIVFSSPGYKSDTVFGAQVRNFETSWLNIALVPDTITSIGANESSTKKLIVWPVPADEKLFYSFYAGRNEFGTVNLIDAGGRVVLNRQISALPGKNFGKVETGSLAAGLYILEVWTELSGRQRKIIIIGHSH